jgi:hypothetical protein
MTEPTKQLLSLYAVFAVTYVICVYIAHFNKIQGLVIAIPTSALAYAFTHLLERVQKLESQRVQELEKQQKRPSEDFLRQNIPSLRRILEFSIGISRQYFQAKTGITDEELEGIDKGQGHYVASAVFWPASSIVIEEWATHTLIRDYAGQRHVLYPGECSALDSISIGRYDPFPIWQYKLPRREGEWFGPVLEIVLHEQCIKFWARDGRFGRRIPPEPEATSENVFAVIPLEEESLAQYRWVPDTSSEDPFLRGAQHPWTKRYSHSEPGADIHKRTLVWHLKVIDLVAWTGKVSE